MLPFFVSWCCCVIFGRPMVLSSVILPSLSNCRSYVLILEYSFPSPFSWNMRTDCTIMHQTCNSLKYIPFFHGGPEAGPSSVFFQTQEETFAAWIPILCFQWLEEEQPTGHIWLLFEPRWPICMGITANKINQKEIPLVST